MVAGFFLCLAFHGATISNLNLRLPLQEKTNEKRQQRNQLGLAMSAYNYKREAEMHACEFVQLGYERTEAREALRTHLLTEHKAMEELFQGQAESLIAELVGAAPSRRASMLRRMTKGIPSEAMMQVALILGAWQHCRRAVLSLERLDDTGHFVAGNPYRYETMQQGYLSMRGANPRHAKWPMQWGKSPFPGEKRWVDSWEMVDYNEAMDDYSPDFARGMAI